MRAVACVRELSGLCVKGGAHGAVDLNPGSMMREVAGQVVSTLAVAANGGACVCKWELCKTHTGQDRMLLPARPILQR